jgi:hypothetical protein
LRLKVLPAVTVAVEVPVEGLMSDRSTWAPAAESAEKTPRYKTSREIFLKEYLFLN